jgi:hypothetical protein
MSQLRPSILMLYLYTFCVNHHKAIILVSMLHLLFGFEFQHCSISVLKNADAYVHSAHLIFESVLSDNFDTINGFVLLIVFFICRYYFKQFFYYIICFHKRHFASLNTFLRCSKISHAINIQKSIILFFSKHHQ